MTQRPLRASARRARLSNISTKRCAHDTSFLVFALSRGSLVRRSRKDSICAFLSASPATGEEPATSPV